MGWYYSAGQNAVRAVLWALTRQEVKGLEHVPREGGVVVASNHISFWDPPLIGAVLPREAHFLAKEELFRNPVFGAVLRSVNSIPIRRGAGDQRAIGQAIATLERGAALLMFPEGSRMRDGQLHPGRPGVGIMAVNAGVPVVPCFISGSDRPSRFVGRRDIIRIRFGPARTWQELAGPGALSPPDRALFQRIADGVMREIAALRGAG